MDEDIGSLKDQLAMIQNQLKANYKNFKGSTKSLFSKLTADLTQKCQEEELILLDQPPKSLLKDTRVEFTNRYASTEKI